MFPTPRQSRIGLGFLLSFASHKTHTLCMQLKHLRSWTLIEDSCDEAPGTRKAVLVQLSPKDKATVTPFACWHQLSPLSAELFCCQSSPATRVYNQSKVPPQFYCKLILVHKGKNRRGCLYADSPHCRVIEILMKQPWLELFEHWNTAGGRNSKRQFQHRTYNHIHS